VRWVSEREADRCESRIELQTRHKRNFYHYWHGLALARVVDLPPQLLKTVEKAEKTYFMDAVSGYLRRAEPALQSLVHPFKVIFAPGQMQVVSVRTATRLV
jgi:hypothetical protein